MESVQIRSKPDNSIGDHQAIEPDITIKGFFATLNHQTHTETMIVHQSLVDRHKPPNTRLTSV